MFDLEIPSMDDVGKFLRLDIEGLGFQMSIFLSGSVELIDTR
jgi:hypothetical protein